MPTVTIYASGAGEWAKGIHAPATSDTETQASGTTGGENGQAYWTWLGRDFSPYAGRGIISGTVRLKCNSTDNTPPHAHTVHALTDDPTLYTEGNSIIGASLGTIDSNYSKTFNLKDQLQGWLVDPTTAYGVATDVGGGENELHQLEGYGFARVTFVYTPYFYVGDVPYSTMFVIHNDDFISRLFLGDTEMT